MALCLGTTTPCPRDRRGRADTPFLTAAADWLVEQQAGLVGIDSLNIDDTSGPSRPVHTALLAAGIPIVEHLYGLDQLPPGGFKFHTTPSRWHKRNSGPCHAILADE